MPMDLGFAENYPNLKANAAFQDLRVTLEGTENRITVARNSAVADGGGRRPTSRCAASPNQPHGAMMRPSAANRTKPNFTVQNEAQISVPPTVGFDQAVFPPPSAASRDRSADALVGPGGARRRLVAGSAARRRPVPVPVLSARVIDQTSTLTPAQAAALSAKLAAIEQQNGAQIVILIVPTARPKTSPRSRSASPPTGSSAARRSATASC